MKKHLFKAPLLTFFFFSFFFPMAFSTAIDSPVDLFDLAVPENIGKAQERFRSSNKTGAERIVIQIQDVHAHLAAQNNIASILERLRFIYGLDKIALEGAWSSTSLPKSQALPTSREKQLLARTLLEEDRISGPVYAAIMSPQPITLIGVEESPAYEENRRLFLTHLSKSKEISAALKNYGASLQSAQQAAWGPDLLAFGRAFGKFREASDLGMFFPLLLKTAAAQSIALSDLSQIALVQDIASLEKSFEKERLEQEIERLMKEYKHTPWTLEELIRGGKIPQEKIGFYPEIKKLLRLYQLRDQIVLGALTSQIEILTKRILEKIVRSPEEKSLWDETERFYLAQKLLLLQASPQDIKSYEKERAFLDSELAAAGLSDALSLALEFYAWVKKRDEIFFQKIMTDPTLAGNIAIVTGGFHTDGLSERFREAGISYITISPDLGKDPANTALYHERISGLFPENLDAAAKMPSAVPSPQSASLSELRNAIAWIDDTFPESLAVLQQTRDVRKAERVFLGTTNAPVLRVSEFMAKPHSKQLAEVRGWLAQEPREKAMLVSSVGILSKMLRDDKNTETLLKRAVGAGDILALAQDVPLTNTPEIISSLRGIERLETPDIEGLIKQSARFQQLSKKHPFAIMQNGRPHSAFVVLPERPESLLLFKIITLNAGLYKAAKDAAFLLLLQDLVAEILSRELSQAAA